MFSCVANCHSCYPFGEEQKLITGGDDSNVLFEKVLWIIYPAKDSYCTLYIGCGSLTDFSSEGNPVVDNNLEKIPVLESVVVYGTN